MKRQLIFGGIMALAMVLSMACSNNEDESPLPEPSGGVQTYVDIVGTMQYDKGLNRWYVYFFHPGSIDAVDAFFFKSSDLPSALMKKDTKVIFSGSAYKVDFGRKVMVSGWQDYFIEFDSIKPYDIEESKAHTSVSGCKSGGALTRSADEQEYVEYEAIGNDGLYLKHVNAMFNCAPEALYVVAEVSGSSIYLKEVEEGALANCICPYDLGCRVGPLTEYQEYTVFIVRGSYVYLHFTVTYTKDVKGNVIITRES